jgi:hypothetical protein
VQRSGRVTLAATAQQRLLACAIDWMPRIDRQTIATDRLVETKSLDAALAAFMAIAAQRLKLAKPKFIPIAFVMSHVVDDFGRDDAAFGCAHSAQRLTR